jgi:SAM-dependent methyltransferase
MYKQLKACFLANPVPPNARALSISHSQDLVALLAGHTVEIAEANYPDHSILALPFSDNEFDLVVSDQVFEHIEGNPQVAIDETLRVAKKGGRIVHTTCFLTPYHGPGDYWRFSPEGLAYLCRHAHKIDQAAGWGHPLVPMVLALGLGRAPVPESRWHPFHWLATVNWSSYAFVVWVVATK